MAPFEQDWKQLNLRRGGVCVTCKLSLQAGTTALWSRSQRIVSCTVHSPTTDSTLENVELEAVTPTKLEMTISQGNAGGSARVENQRRIKRREERVTKRFPRAGKFILAITDEPQSTRAWAVGAKGEVAVGKELDSLAIKYGFRVLHDRLIPRSRANIDHLAITKYGVFVIDAKNYQGVVRVKDSSSFFEKSAPELWVGKRNCMKLVAGVKNQISIVNEVLQGNSLMFPVVGVLAFNAAKWETFKILRSQLEVDGVLINSKGIEAIVSREGSLSTQEMDAATQCLATKLVSAT